ncbi:branched-chain amino acid ABC transporter permease [Halorientalis litorea]|uniref:branched-chain amino acid ABC transporter permease n=1 Tax=Halorientalis litorea TaxID=2931977 RepID=UPI001FF4CF28|nr:branched-chain amino acid ABC transporter permease [Halorientalis litorea]
MSEESARPEDAAAIEGLDIDLAGVDWPAVVRQALYVLVPGLLFIPFAASNIGFIARPILIFAIIAMGYNIMVGWPDLLVFCPAAIAIVGGVSSGLLAQAGVPFLVAFLLGGVAGALVGVVVALIAIIIRTSFDFVIATLALEQLIFTALVIWAAVGPAGLRVGDIETPSIAGMALTGQVETYLFLLAVLIFSVVVVAAFDNSLLGTLSVATGENEDLLTSIGYQPSKYKFVSLVLGAFLLGIGGASYIHVNNLMVPNSWVLPQTVILLTIIVVGGLRTIHGPIVGALVMVGIPEFSRLLGISGFQQYLIGGALIAIVLFAPAGILGTYQNRVGISIRDKLRGLWS